MIAMMNNNDFNQDMGNLDKDAQKNQIIDEFEQIDIIKLDKKNKNEKKIKKAGKEKLEAQQEQLQRDNRIQKQNDDIYKFLLKRVINKLQESDVKPLEENKMKLPRIQIQPEGKRTAIINFTAICKKINRAIPHVMIFFINQLMVPGSLTEKVGFLIRQKLSQRQVENLFKKYIAEFVKCKQCGSSNTEVNKYPKKKQMTMECNNCKASRDVRALKHVQL